MRYFLELSYKGTAYHGWQVQANALGIQQVVEEKLSILLRSSVNTICSGRTDTGVHARQQFVQFDSKQALQNDFLFKVNRILPSDIAAHSLQEVRPDANARFDAFSREYTYVITRTKDPFLRNLSLQFGRPLDIGKMNQAAGLLLQFNDFQSFSKVHTQVNHFRCAIQHAEWSEQENLLIFTIQANRFLRGMVRTIVGSLLDIGLEKISETDFIRIIKSGDRKKAGWAAPPEGLYLSRVSYPETLFISKPI